VDSSFANVDASELPGTPLIEPDGTPVDSRVEPAFAMATGEDEHSDIRRFAARGSRWKAVIEREKSSGAVRSEEVFDLETDPGETDPLSASEAEESEGVVDLFDRLREFSASRLEAVEETVVEDIKTSSEIDERLEALGYK